MKILHFMVLMVIVFKIHGQNINTNHDNELFKDSLKTIINKTKNDSIISILNFKLAALNLTDNEEEEFVKRLGLGIKYAKKYPFLVDLSGYYKALSYLNHNNIDKFASEINLTREKLKKYNNDESIKIQLIILQNLSTYYNIKGQDKKSIKLLIEESIPISIRNKKYGVLPDFYRQVGALLNKTGDFKKSKIYYNKAISQYFNNSKNGANKDVDLIIIYIDASKNLLDLNNPDKSSFLLSKVDSILKKSSGSNLYNLYYKAKGEYFSHMKNYQESILYYDLAIQHSQGIDSRDDLYKIQILKSQSLYFLENYKDSYSILKEISGKNDFPAVLKINLLKYLSLNAEKLNYYKEAYFYSKNYLFLKDSIESIKNKETILEFEAKYSNSENKRKIINLENEKEKAELVAKNNKLYYVVFGMLSGILLLVLFFLWKINRNQKKINNQKDVIHNQKLINLKNQKDVEVMQALIDGEELERKRVARDLHDSIGSKLSSLKILFSRVSNDIIKRTDIESLEVLLNDSIHELRQVSYNLVPESLLNLGLENAIIDLCFSLNSDVVKIECQIFGVKKDLSESIQTSIFRIVQELINNALKHSKGTEVLVSCSQNKSAFLITVEDNGIGFNSKELYKKSGLGLKNIKNRVDILNGYFNCLSDSNGTCINIELEVK